MRKILIATIALVTVVSCQDLTELNRDIKNPEEVGSDALFANATTELVKFMASPNVNINNLRLWSQHWTQTTYTDESNYLLTERNVNGSAWNILYSTVWRDLSEAKMILADDEFLTDENKKNQTAIMDVLEVFAGHLLVDFFGHVPYSEALGDDVTPGYDKPEDIYDELFSKLNAAIGNLDGESALGSADLIYGGDVSQWRKFANSLKLRMAIRISDVQEAKAQGFAEDAVNDGVFTSSSDNMALTFSSATPHTNPLWEDLVQSGRKDFVASNTLVDHMNALEDPRRQYFFTGPMDSVGNPMGGVHGRSNDYNEFTQIETALLTDPTFPGTLLSYTEVEFLLAHAAELWGGVFGTAEEHYNAGVTQSILFWGGTEQEANDYLANTDVAWTTAPGDWREKIGMQKWIAMYNKGFEAWSTYRLYDAPEMNEAYSAGTVPPNRYSYPVSEYSLNEENVEEADDNYAGNSKLAPIFWDVP